MVTNRRKRIRRFRGTRTCGWGLVHRGSGNKGGAGNSATGKKAQAKKPILWGSNFGKTGFTNRNPGKKYNTITLKETDLHIEKWTTQGTAQKKGNEYTIDLTKTGYNKLLGTGKTTKIMHITVEQASKSAHEKIKNAKGTITITNSKIKKEETKEKKITKEQKPTSTPQ